MLLMLALIVLYEEVYDALYLFSYVLDLGIHHLTLMGVHVLQLL